MCGAIGVLVANIDGQLEELSCGACGAGGARLAPGKATSADYNVRYAAYSKSNGHTPREQLSVDEVMWPGGRMAGFITWIAKRWRVWDAKRKQGPNHIRSTEEHDAFSRWLTTSVETGSLEMIE